MEPSGYSSGEADERTRGALAASSTAVWELDIQTRKVTWAANLEGVFKRPIDTLETGLRTIHPADEPWVRAACMATIEERRDYRVECRVLWPDGTVRWIVSNGRVVESEDKPPRFIGSTTDITDRRTPEHQRHPQKVEVFCRHATRVAHDFNNLLTIIHGYGQFLTGQGHGHKQPGDVREILRAAERARELTNELLTMSRQLGYRVTPDPRPPAPGAPQRRKILVIEDQAPVRALVRRILERGGFEVLEANAAPDADRLFAEHHADIVLLLADVGIPGEKGPALYRRLSLKKPELKVIYMSGDIQDSVLAGEAPSPQEQFVGKPFTARGLLEAVKKILGE